MCRRCTTTPTKDAATQTDWNRYVKAVQVKPKTAVKNIGCCIPAVLDKGIQAVATITDACISTEVSTQPSTFSIRPNIEEEEEEEIPSDSDSDSSEDITSLEDDPDYDPETSDVTGSFSANTVIAPENVATITDEPKFLVFQSCLEMLFAHCCECGSQTTSTSFVFGKAGTLLRVDYDCKEGHHGTWLSQPILRHRMAAGNLLLSAATLFSGSTYERVREMAEVMKLPIMSQSQFYSIQRKYLFPVVHTAFTEHKEALIASTAVNLVTLVGDGRCDSPGFSAKYGTYNVMDAKSGAVLTFSLQQVDAQTSSVAMETNGCFEAIVELLHHGLNIEVFGTDCSTSIAKLMRDYFPHIHHEHDVYHIEKRVKKMLLQKANHRDNHALHAWIKPVINQLWWAAQTCNRDAVELREKWLSIMYHITNHHEWDMFEVYKRCAHPPLTVEEKRMKRWLKVDSPPHSALKEVILNKRLVADIEKLTRAVHTGSLEAFHSLLTKYVPKRQHFSYRGMLVRTELAVLDHNKNLNREQAVTAEGVPRYNAVFPKRTREWVAKPVSQPKCHKWRQELVSTTLRFQSGAIAATVVPVPETLPQNIADTPRPSKQDIIDKTTSRFASAQD